MDFLEAINEMEKGKILKHNNALYKRNNHATCPAEEFLVKYELVPDWVYTGLCLSDMKANDWNIVDKPKRTLWDKRFSFTANCEKGYFEYLGNDVKEFLNEFIDWLVLEESYGKMVNFEERVRDKAKEIFGEELLK